MQYITTFWHRLSETLNQERVMRHVVIVSFAIVLCFVCLSINRGIGFSDESWYLVLLRDHVAKNASAWPLFFSWLPNNLLVIRMITVGLLFTGSMLFGYGMYSYFKVQFKLSQKSIIPLMMFGFIGAFCFLPPICLVPCYYWFNHFIFSSGIGSALLCAKRGKVGIGWAWLSGFFFGFLFFIMPSNTPIILFVAAFIIFNPNPWHRLIGFGVGMACAILVYSLAIQSLAEFYLMIQQSLHDSPDFLGSHGITQMIVWIIKTVKFIITNIFIVAALIYFLRRHIDEISVKRETLSIWVSLIVIVSFTIIPYFEGLVWGVKYGIYPSEIISVLFIWFILETQNELISQDWSVLTLLFISPILASFGTNVPFSIRGTIYIGTFYGTAGLLFVLSPFCARFRIYMCLAVVLLTFGFVTTFFRPNWSTDMSLSKNIIPLSEIGIQKRTRITPEMSTMISEAKKFIGFSNNVVVKGQQSWGFVYLLDLHPLSYSAIPYESQILKAIEESGMRELVFIESSKDLFSESFWSEINTKWKTEKVREFDGKFKFYRLNRISILPHFKK